MRAVSIGRTRLEWVEIGIILLIILIHLPSAFAGQHAILDWFQTDDAFYYFKTAQNISEGHGVTFDGTSTTNGFQPLWMVVLVPVFSLARIDLFLPLRLVIALQTVIAAATALLLYRLMRRTLSGVVSSAAALAFAFIPRVHEAILMGGTEAGLNALLIAFLLYRTSIETARAEPRVYQLGLIAALTFFARLDNVFLVGATGIWLIAARWLDSAKPGIFDWRQNLKLAVRYYLPLLLLGGGYVGLNQALFGYPTPISAQVKAWWGTLELTVYGFPIHRPIDFIGQFVTNNPNLGPWSIITGPMYAIAEEILARFGLPMSLNLRRGFLLIEALSILTLVGGLLRLGRKEAPISLANLPLPPLLAACLMQISYYKLTGHLAQKPWYWISEALAIILLGALAVDTALRMLRRWKRGPGLSYVALVMALSLIVMPQLRRLPELLAPGSSTAEHYYLQRSDWLEQQTEAGARIGMTGSGSAGYFTQDRTIVNLDGLISGREYFQALRGGTGAQYLGRIGLDYVFGNAYILLETQPYRDIFSGRLTPVQEWPGFERDLYLWRFEP
jgi:hypothetical protein